MVCAIGNSAVIDETATGVDNGFAPTGAGYKLFDKSEFRLSPLVSITVDVVFRPSNKEALSNDQSDDSMKTESTFCGLLIKGDNLKNALKFLEK